MHHKNKVLNQIDYEVLQGVLSNNSNEDRVILYQSFRLEAYNYLRQLEGNIEAIGIASKFSRSALIFAGNSLSKACLALVILLTNNGFTVLLEAVDVLS